VIVLDRLLIGGLRFVLDKVAAAVDSELDDPARLREELLAAQMRHELGEIDDRELAELEAELLPRLRRLREEQLAAGPISFDADEGRVEIELGVHSHLEGPEE
jgi:hypothetical protein